MATSYPTGLDSYATLVDNVDDVLAAHANDRGDAIEAIESKVGITNSTVNTTVDYFLKHSSGAFRTHIHDGSSDDGAQLDWDTCWTDAVHNHSSAAEGGTDLTGATITIPSGSLVSRTHTQSGTYSNIGSVAIPNDNTKPEKTEGNLALSHSHTPTSATNILYITVTMCFGAASTGQFVVALLKDTDTYALAAAQTYSPSSGMQHVITFTHKMTAGTTSAITFKVHIGGDTTNAIHFNGVSSGAKMDGVMASSIDVAEVKA